MNAAAKIRNRMIQLQGELESCGDRKVYLDDSDRIFSGAVPAQYMFNQSAPKLRPLADYYKAQIKQCEMALEFFGQPA